MYKREKAENLQRMHSFFATGINCSGNKQTKKQYFGLLAFIPNWKFYQTIWSGI